MSNSKSYKGKAGSMTQFKDSISRQSKAGNKRHRKAKMLRKRGRV